MRAILSQSTTIFKKNLLLDWRNKSELLKELLVPFMSVIVLIASNHVDKMGLNLIDFMLKLLYLLKLFFGITFIRLKLIRQILKLFFVLFYFH